MSWLPFKPPFMTKLPPAAPAEPEPELFDDITPTDRPLMRSDVDDVRRSIETLRRVVERSEQRQLELYALVKRRAEEPRVMAIVCAVAALVCLGCAVAGLPR